MNRQQLMFVTKVLKEKFSNLTVEEVIDLATKIIEGVENMNPRVPPSSFGVKE